MINDIQEVLHAWGAWCRDDSMSLDCKSPSEMIMRSAPHAEASETATVTRCQSDYISDDMALRIDRIVTVLLKYKPIEGKCLRMRYIQGKYPEHIAHTYLSELKYGKGSKRKVSKYKASEYIASAEGFVLGRILDAM